jgi:uncharacterized protein (DUF885 family)
MRRTLPITALSVLAALAALLVGCAGRPDTRSSEGPMSHPPSAEDARFADLARRWLDGTMRLSPIWATSVGDHRFDTEVDDVTPEGDAKSLAFAEGMLAELDGIDTGKLGRENQIDAGILRTQLEGSIWTSKTLREHTWNPLYYNDLAGNAIYLLLARDFAPLPERLDHAATRIEKLPALLAQARKNLDPARVPKIHAETVAKQNHGIISLVDELIVPQLGKLPAAQRTRLEAAIAALRPAVAEHQKWIDEVLVPNAAGDFRIGADKYDHKLGFALSSTLSRKEIRERAEKELARVRGEMYGIARVVLKDKPGAPELPAEPSEAQQQKAIEAALELAYVDHPARADVVKVATSALAEATAFVRAKDLVSVPDDPVKVILMPEFQRGVTVAYCDSPGPLDRGQATYYAISPIPEDWSAEQTESFLREYNTRMLHLLSIHEAMPGHYLEGAHSAMHPSVLRAVLRSGTFAEGWAVYTEQMMAHAGYLNGDPLFRLVQLKFYLRTIGNAILDQGVHVDGWTREQAMDLMVRLTFQQEREAAGKWVRAQLTSAQLPTYFVGVQEQLDLRKAVEAREGTKFDAKRYHDTVLSFGAPPVRYVREMMLDEPIR